MSWVRGAVVIVAIAAVALGGLTSDGGQRGAVTHLSDLPEISSKVSNVTDDSASVVAVNTTLTRLYANGSVAVAGAPPRPLANVSVVGHGLNVSAHPAVAGAAQNQSCLAQVRVAANETIRTELVGAAVAVVEVSGQQAYRVVPYSGNRSVSGLLLARGYAVVTVGSVPEAQTVARHQNRGIWQCVEAGVGAGREGT